MAKKRIKKKVEKGRVYISATFNNTIITVTDQGGNTLCWGSSGTVGFKGTRKSTPFAAIQGMKEVVQKIKEIGLKEAEVYVKGPGAGRDSALRVLRTSGLNITLIADVTPMPHNGVRPRKKRRV